MAIENEYSEEIERLFRRATKKPKSPFDEIQVTQPDDQDLSKMILDRIDAAVRFRMSSPTLEERVTILENKMQKIMSQEEKQMRREKLSANEIANLIYLVNKKELEKTSFGKIVAIDVKSGKIAGIGETLKEAYLQAEKKTGQKKFAFRKVGFSSVCKLR